ncbi:MAG: hypothetical protein ABI673_08290 [Novosphingobium sp.]
MITVKQVLAALTPEQKRGALVLLDHMSRPLTQKEIETCLVAKGVARHRAVLIGSAVKGLHIVALVGGDDRG